ncbi:NCS2 family permease [Mesoplasma syrphidae]|uniref:NCS2 family permease n=1 Tax=Mesoplasma syrphidae TaxID=225999 RepID=A0A2K9BNL7_9MOLU|nr:NCS2 family permease [Mesoplasma syrphidae]AUF83633.1 NCS2 family permease [Mesoplasma syrphidae]
MNLENKKTLNQSKLSEDSFPDFGTETSEQTAIRNAQNFKFSNNRGIAAIEKYFKFDTLGATMKKEIWGGLATFLSLIYILSLNPSILGESNSINSELAKMNYFGIFLATAIASGIASIVMGLFANVPIAVSTSMGMNAMFTFNIANRGLGYEGGLIVVLISSIIFTIISITPLRTIIIKAMPKGLMIAFAIGIGFFITYVGLANMGWYKTAEASSIPSAALASFKTNFIPILLGMGCLGIILILHFKKVPGAVAIGILSMATVAIIIANTLPNSHALVSNNGALANSNFRLDGNAWSYDFKGFNTNLENTWSQFTNSKIWTNPITYVSIFVFVIMNFFDATGTIAAMSNQLNRYTNQHKEIPHKALVIDSGATVVGALLGTSPVNSYVESGAGIQQGARTGLAAILNGILFFAAIALFPIFRAVPVCVSGAACVYIGMMMVSELKDVEWKKPEFALTTFLVIVFMITTYSIAEGIAIGTISYVFVMAVTKRAKQIGFVMWTLALLFIVYWIALAFMQV